MANESISKCFHYWAVGIGTLLLSLVAIYAAFQTKGVLGEIFKVQLQAKDIHNAVEKMDNAIVGMDRTEKEIKEGVLELRKIVLALKEEFKKATVRKAVGMLPENPTKADISKALDTISKEPGSMEPYLLMQERHKVEEAWSKSITPEEREKILFDSLQIRP